MVACQHDAHLAFAMVVTVDGGDDSKSFFLEELRKNVRFISSSDLKVNRETSKVCISITFCD